MCYTLGFVLGDSVRNYCGAQGREVGFPHLFPSESASFTLATKSASACTAADSKVLSFATAANSRMLSFAP